MKFKSSWLSILMLAISVGGGFYFFNFFCGCLYQDPVDIAVDTSDRLNQPPIILYPTADPPWNVTFTVTTGSLGDGEPLTVYQYWYFWAGCQLAPQGALCLAGHAQNDWEPVYIYWKTTNPFQPSLLAVYTRIHFLWKQTSGSLVTLNGTQIILTFSTIYHTPTVDTGLLNQFVKPTNASLSIPYNTNGAPPFALGTWYYPLPTGNRYIAANTALQIWVDPLSPPATGPTAFENDSQGNAGPINPLNLYGTTQAIQNGVLAGFLSTAGIFVFLTLDVRAFNKARTGVSRALRPPRGAGAQYGQFLGFNVLLSVTGWIISLLLGSFLFNNANIVFQTIASIVPLPPPYYGSSSLWAFFIAGAIWFAIASGITVLFFRRRPSRASSR